LINNKRKTISGGGDDLCEDVNFFVWIGGNLDWYILLIMEGMGKIYEIGWNGKNFMRMKSNFRDGRELGKFYRDGENFALRWGRIWKNLQEYGRNGIKFFNRIILNCDHQWHLKIVVKYNQGWAFDKNKE